MLDVSVLFVPFDAALQHYRRNAERGVIGYTMEVHPGQPPGEKRRCGEEMRVEDTGVAIDFKQKSKTLGDRDASLTCLLEAAYDQARTVAANEYYHPDASSKRRRLQYNTVIRRKMTELFPDILFLSEQPKGLEFPGKISLMREITLPVTYECIGTAGSLPVQRIFGYIRSDLKDQWSSRELVKRSGGPEEKLLAVSGTIAGVKLCVAGVHLTSNNTKIAADTSAYNNAIAALRTFCSANGIDVAIGDFNLDLRMASRDRQSGGVGILPSSMIFIAKNEPAPMGTQWKEQYSNSANDKHYMGCMVVNTAAITLQDQHLLSLQRSVKSSGERAYHSDHPPIYARLEL